ncbi:MAG TPA: VIT1/CCC1 transporter family protein [Steroidobacteraceae bacterium]|nr:VIT1/CCC1 transporter family protein [Steroidobacteraceae bacterium]
MPADDIKRFQANLRDELDGAALYTQVAAAEPDPIRKDLFLQLAQAEATHAELWRKKLAAAGVKERPYVPGFRTRLLGKLARRFGPAFVMPTIAAAEFSDRNKYANQVDARSISAEEQGHAAVVQEIARTSGRGAVSGADIARAEPWHRGASGNNLRAAVLGANDGLVSNFCLIMGVAGAGTSNRTILLTGVAGLAAGACSMALGEWLSVTNARELARTQIAKEAEEVERTPEAEEHELALIYQAKGLNKADAQRVAAELMSDKKAALDTLAREELGIDPTELGGNPWSAAATSFALFSMGAIFPAFPFLWLHGNAAMATSIGASSAALCAIGLLTSLFNGRSPWFSAARQVLFGCAAAALTYGLGLLLGVTLS